jgi:hypothetical protein
LMSSVLASPSIQSSQKAILRAAVCWWVIRKQWCTSKLRRSSNMMLTMPTCYRELPNKRYSLHIGIVTRSSKHNFDLLFIKRYLFKNDIFIFL